jgi:hypothetical protein
MRWWIAALILASCAPAILASCAPAPSPPSSPPPARSSSPAPQPTVVATPWWEVSGDDEGAELIGHVPEHGEYRVTLKQTTAITGAPDGGAFVLYKRDKSRSEEGSERRRVLARLDPRGQEIWRSEIAEGTWQWRLFAFGDGAVAYDLGRWQLHFIDGAGVESGQHKHTVYLSDLAARGDVFVVADEHGVTRFDAAGQPVWDAPMRLFPSAESAGSRGEDRYVAVGMDGTVLSGAEDGSLIALTAQGTPRFQLGVRGPITRIETRRDGGFDVLTAEQLFVVDTDGRVEARPFELEALAHRLVDHRESQFARPGAAPIMPPPIADPTSAYAATPVVVGDEPLLEVQSLVVVARDDVWALGQAGELPTGTSLFHYDGRRWAARELPQVAFDEEVFATGSEAQVGEFRLAMLARGPSGLLAIGTRVAKDTRLCVLAYDGSVWRERREFFSSFADIKLRWGSANNLTYAAGIGGRELICYGGSAFAGEGQCVAMSEGVAPHLVALSDARIMAKGYDIVGHEGSFLHPRVYSGATLWRINGSATSADDVWGTDGRALGHWDGQALTTVAAPAGIITSLWAHDGLWLSGGAGLLHYNGKAFARIAGIPRGYNPHAPTDLHVTGMGQDVWAYGATGAWHVQPASNPANLVVKVSRIQGPSPGSQPLEPGPAPYHLERVTLAVEGETRPLQAAISIAASDDALWFFDGVRLVEQAGGRTRLLYRAAAPKPFVCWSAPEPDCGACADCSERRPYPLPCTRCAAPTSRGTGTLIAEEGVMTFRGGTRDGSSSSPLPQTSAVTALGDDVWAVSAQRDDGLPHAALASARGVQLVRGLPALAYMDVHARGDDLWLAGGQTSGGDLRPLPAGEGALVHYDGKTAVQHRAPEGPLLAVAAVGPAEAWAVGVAGGILRVRAGKVEPMRLGRVTLRAATARSATDVWLAGDDSTLLHFDGELRVVDTRAAGSRAAFTAVLPPDGTTPGWVVGPSGIWRIHPR